jgi:hypothetical protein
MPKAGWLGLKQQTWCCSTLRRLASQGIDGRETLVVEKAALGGRR